MFGIALELKREDFLALVTTKKSAIVGLFAHFVLLPLSTFLLVVWLRPHPATALGMFLVAACPGGNMSNVFTHLAKGNVALAIGLTSVSHFLALALTPLNFSLYASIYLPTRDLLTHIHLSFAEVASTMALVVALPLIFGLLINHRRPQLAAALQKRIKYLPVIALAAFLILAVFTNRNLIVDALQSVFPLVMLHNAIALFSGFLFAKGVGLSHKDVRTITFETGVQNSGLALLLIFTFFQGQSEMATIACCWGVWHLISGGLLSLWWGRKHQRIMLKRTSALREKKIA